MSSLLSLRLSVDYENKPEVLKNVCLDLASGETRGLVGQSGSGKSTLALAVLRLLHLKKATATGEIIFRGRDLMKLSEREMRRMRGREIALVLQSPSSALNPALRIGTQLKEAWRAHADGSWEAGKEEIEKLLGNVDLPSGEDFLRRFPGQISTGQAQRVLIAMAVIHRPALLVADEPGSALDAITQTEVLALLSRLNRELNMAVIYISHDLLSVANFCQTVAIMHEGCIVESGSSDRIFANPSHPYTRRLIEALPKFPTLRVKALA